MTPPITIGGDTVDAITIDGDSVKEVTVDGSTVFSALPDSAVLRLQYNDDADTSTATDSIGNNDGSINGATYTTSQVQEGSNALDFDPANDAHVTVQSDPVMDVSDFWLSTWFVPRSIGNFGAVVTRGQTSSSSPLYGLRFDDTNTLFAFYDDGTAVEQAFNTSFSTGTAYHLIATGNSTDGIDVYVDGSPDNGSGSEGGWDHASDDLAVGRRAGSDQNYMDMIADDTILGSEVLTDEQAADLYNLY